MLLQRLLLSTEAVTAKEMTRRIDSPAVAPLAT